MHSQAARCSLGNRSFGFRFSSLLLIPIIHPSCIHRRCSLWNRLCRVRPVHHCFFPAYSLSRHTPHYTHAPHFSSSTLHCHCYLFASVHPKTPRFLPKMDTFWGIFRANMHPKCLPIRHTSWFHHFPSKRHATSYSFALVYFQVFILDAQIPKSKTTVHCVTFDFRSMRPLSFARDRHNKNDI